MRCYYVSSGIDAHYKQVFHVHILRGETLMLHAHVFVDVILDIMRRFMEIVTGERRCPLATAS